MAHRFKHINIKSLLFTSICLMLVFLLAGCAGSAPDSSSINDSTILTEWGELTLILPENEEVGEYFIKTE